MTLEVYDGAGALLGSATAGTQAVYSGSYAVFVLPGQVQRANGVYRLTLTFVPTAGNAGSLALAKSADATDGWT